MASLQEAIEYARQNPESDFAIQLKERIQSGAADQDAQNEGVDLTVFGRSQETPTSEIDTEQERHKTFMERVKTRLGERRETIAGKLEKDIETEQLTPARKALRISGGVAGGVSDIIFEVIRPVAEPLMRNAGKLIQTLGDVGLSEESKEANRRGEEEFKKQFSAAKELVEKKMESDPEFAAKMRDVGDIGNIGTFILDAIGLGETLTAGKSLGKTGIELGKEALETAGEVTTKVGRAGVEAVRTGTKGIFRGIKERTGEAADRVIQFFETGTFSGAPKDLNKFVDESIERAIRPSVAGKQTTGDIEKYNQKARQAVLAVADNKENLQFLDDAGDQISRLPQSVKEFGDAVAQTKQQVFKQYDALAKQAGEEGVKVNLKPIADELDQVSSNKVIMDNRPEVASYATQRAKALRTRGAYTPDEAQEAIKLYNASLDAFYRNPSVENANRVAIDAMIANRMRSGLDDIIEKTTGAEYQELKNLYGSLKSIEKDITKRAVVEARKNAKGLIDYTDIFSAGDIVRGVVSMNPAFIAKGAFQGAIKSFYKRWVSPDATIKRMFDALENAGI